MEATLHRNSNSKQSKDIDVMACKEVAEGERIIRAHILRDYESQVTQSEDWRNLPEVPTKSEILDKEDEHENKDFFEEWNAYQKDPLYDLELPHNIVKGPWPSKEAYIAAHYQILREDAIAGLRSSVKTFKRQPHMGDDSSTLIYTNVHFTGMVLSPLGCGFRVEFSHDRAGKQIRWQQSSRLQQGTMVALSPMNDSFRSVCKIATVAARPFEGGLDQNPPKVDLFWGDDEDAVFDPVETYVMVESRTGYFEASRHMLVALQKLRTEGFRLSKHLVELDQNVGVPEWLEEQRFLNLTSLVRQGINTTTPIPADEELGLVNADVLHGFPAIPSSGMDDSQLRACERMVTKTLSIVQGPPGTGKSFTSVSALRILIENMKQDSPPIVLSAQTNHALDQLLNHIMVFEPNVLRLGGRSDKGNVEILKRTLYMLRSTTTTFPNAFRGMRHAKVMVEDMQKEIQVTTAPLVAEDVLSDETLLQFGIITEAQKKSLSDNEEGWVCNNHWGQDVGGPSPLYQWTGDNLVPVPRAPLVNFGLPVEESDLEYEQLQQVEQENEEVAEEKSIDALSGLTITFRRAMTGRCPPGTDDRKIKKILSSKKDLHEIPSGMRGQVYRYLEKKLNSIILVKLKRQLREYKSAIDELQIVKSVNNFRLIRHLGIKVIGCTTTGLSKYRSLLAALRPRILLIEEAAETLEGTVMAGMFESLEQLILVGDHKQLQANANVRALESGPYHLSISMFERLVGNSIGFTMLNQQRRMIPDIRKLLCIEPVPFYKDLYDHPSVLERRVNRVPIPGMGGKDIYFFNHNWPELKTADMSQCNPDEADMIAEFFNYLVLNGIACSKITVLTFYNGQRKTILRTLKRHPILGANTYFNVFTVDSYQGEENDVILLSLVRSNETANIGFLDSKNRLVVALSRARRGLYVFGNSVTLTCQETSYGEDRQGFVRDPIWRSIIDHLRDKMRYELDGGLPITCSNHRRTVRIYDAAGWKGLAGGCHLRCTGALHCGHPCPYLCHPFDHSRVICSVPCTKSLKCGHACSSQCGEDCCCSMAECRKPVSESSGVRSTFGIVTARDTRSDSPTRFGKSGLNQLFQLGSAASLVLSRKATSRGKDGGENGTRTDNVFRALSGQRTQDNLSPRKTLQKFDDMSNQPYMLSLAKGSPSAKAAVHAWNTWDAKKADREASERRQRITTEAPKVDRTSLVYNDTHRAIKIKDGVRLRDHASSSTAVIPRFGSFSPSVSEDWLKGVSENAPLVLPAENQKQPVKDLTKSPSAVPSHISCTGLVKQGDLNGSSKVCGSKRGVSAAKVRSLIDCIAPPDRDFPTPINFGSEIATPATPISMSSILADLEGLEIVVSFGSAADFDEFEKRFG